MLSEADPPPNYQLLFTLPCQELAQKRESEIFCVLGGTSMFLEQGSFYLVAQH